MCRFEKGAADGLASGSLAHVEVFDAGEVPAGGEVKAIGDDGYAEYLVFRPGGEYFQVSGLDGFSQAVGEILGDWLAVPEGFLEEIQGLGQACRRDRGDLERAQRSMALEVILAAASTAFSISSCPTSRCVHRRT